MENSDFGRSRRTRGRLQTALPSVLLALLILTGCGDAGERGEQGEPGEDGASCSVESSEEGALIKCDDGTSQIVSDGGGCTVEEEDNSAILRCEDGTEATIDAAEEDGCSIARGPNGGVTVECDDGTSTVIVAPDPTAPQGDYLELRAGVMAVGTNDGIGTLTRMDGALDGDFDPSGEFLYFVDTFNNTIRRFSVRTKRVVTIAGQAGSNGVADGIGAQARFDGPRGIAVHPDGLRVFIADGFNCTIRQLDLDTMQVSTLAGQPGSCAAEDGAFQDARFRLTIGMQIDDSGQYLYIADRGNDVIRRLDLDTEVVETIAGQLPTASSPDVSGYADGVGPAARFDGPGGIALSPDSDTLYVNDTFNNVIRSISLTSGSQSGQPAQFEVSTLAGSAGESGGDDGIGSNARFSISQSLTMSDGELFASGFNGTIRRINPSNGEVTTVAGQPSNRGSSDGPSYDARFGVSFGICAHPDGRRLYYMDRGNNSIRVFDRLSSQVETAMGAPEPSAWRDGPVGESRLSDPEGIWANADGTHVYLADSGNHVIRRYDTDTGELSTIAGLPEVAGFADGRYDQALFDSPTGIWVDSDETYAYVADYGNDAIRRIELSTREVDTVAGRPLADGETATDGNLDSALFDAPIALTGIADGNATRLYVSGFGSDLIRSIQIGQDEVTTVAGGAEDDTSFSGPHGIAVSSDGDTLYVADELNQVIRKIDMTSSETSTVAGDIGVRDAFDGVGRGATFGNPSQIALAEDENALYVADLVNYAIRRVDLSSAEVTTVVGDLGTSGGSGQQVIPIDEARLYFTPGVAITGDDLFLTSSQGLFEVPGLRATN
jgi:DNA-binding beta-propeller fold protein YncE